MRTTKLNNNIGKVIQFPECVIVQALLIKCCIDCNSEVKINSKMSIQSFDPSANKYAKIHECKFCRF